MPSPLPPPQPVQCSRRCDWVKYPEGHDNGCGTGCKCDTLDGHYFQCLDASAHKLTNGVCNGRCDWVKYPEGHGDGCSDGCKCDTLDGDYFQCLDPNHHG